MFRLGETVDVKKAKSLSSIVLAFIGDAVYSLYVREKVALLSDSKTGELNKLAVNEVNASAQAEFVREIIPLLTDEELQIFKRARNAKKATKSKSATVIDYHLSTGFEALVGFLYITGQYDRLNYILHRGNENEN